MSRTRPRLVLAAIALVATMVMAACASTEETPDASPSEGAGTFPVTLTHEFGETTIEKQPERIASVGYASNDAALALGVVPVAMTEAWGGDKEGVLPWNREKLDELGAETPKILPLAELDVEAVAASTPDLILANYSGITKEEYDLLSKIAPTVAYTDEPWATPWRDVVTTVGEALGKSDEAKQLLADVDTTMAQKAEEHPELEGKTVAAVWDTEEFYVYKPADSRVEFLTGLGLEHAPSVTELDNGDQSFLYGLSREQTDKLTSDILIFYAADQKEADAFLKKPYAQAMSQIKEKRYAAVVGTELVAAVSPPTVLSLQWGLDDYVELISTAAEAQG